MTKQRPQLNVAELEQRVKKMYREVALHPEVKYHFEMGRNLAERLGYPKEILNEIPSQSIASFAGVGYFFDLADLQAGDTVVDLGSGAGMDVFFAAQQVGNSGRVIGLDMTVEQLEKSEFLRKIAAYDQVVFRESYIENIAVPDNTADAIISNGVINLSNEKPKVFAEAARVLKKGGKLIVSDIVTEIDLPESISCDATLWAACIGGAMQKNTYFEALEQAGFKIVRTKTNPYSFISKSAQGATDDYGISSISILAIKQ